MSTLIDQSTTQKEGLDSLRERRADLLAQQAALPVTDLSLDGTIRLERDPELERELARVEAEIAVVEAREPRVDDLERQHADAEEAREEAHEAEVARVLALDEAVVTYDLAEVERHLAHLDPDHVLTAEAYRVWERRRAYLVELPDESVPSLTRHVAELRRRRRDWLDSLLVDVNLETGEPVYRADPEVRREIAKLEVSIAECEGKPGIVGAPEHAPDPLVLAAAEAQQKIAELEERRAPLALAVMEGRPGARDELADLENQLGQARFEHSTAVLAGTERARVEAEEAEAERRAELERLKEEAAERAHDRDRAFAEVVAAVETLVPAVKAAIDAELAAQAAARAAEQTFSDQFTTPARLVLAALQHAGVAVADVDVPHAAWRERMLQTWRRPELLRKGDLRCAICSDPQRAIRVAELAAAGLSHATIADQVSGTSRSGIQRHLSSHPSHPLKEAAS